MSSSGELATLGGSGAAQEAEAGNSSSPSSIITTTTPTTTTPAATPSATPSSSSSSSTSPAAEQPQQQQQQHYYVRLRGIPFQATEQQLIEFLSGCTVLPPLIPKGQTYGRRMAGEMYARLGSRHDRETALTKHRHMLGHRYIEVFPAEELEVRRFGCPEAAAASSSSSSDEQLPVARLFGLPWSASEGDVMSFLSGCALVPHVGVPNMPQPSPVIIARALDGRSLGEAFVRFTSAAERDNAIASHNNERMGGRVIELVPVSTLADMLHTLSRLSNTTVMPARGPPPGAAGGGGGYGPMRSRAPFHAGYHPHHGGAPGPGGPPPPPPHHAGAYGYHPYQPPPTHRAYGGAGGPPVGPPSNGYAPPPQRAMAPGGPYGGAPGAPSPYGAPDPYGAPPPSSYGASMAPPPQQQSASPAYAASMPYEPYMPTPAPASTPSYPTATPLNGTGAVGAYQPQYGTTAPSYGGGSMTAYAPAGGMGSSAYATEPYTPQTVGPSSYASSSSSSAVGSSWSAASIPTATPYGSSYSPSTTSAGGGYSYQPPSTDTATWSDPSTAASDYAAASAAAAAQVFGPSGSAGTSTGQPSSTSASSSASSSYITLRMRGLPWAAKETDVAAFFEEKSYGTGAPDPASPYGVVEGSIQILRDQSGRAIGEATVGFWTLSGAQRALREKHRQVMTLPGSTAPRYIELFWG